MKLILRNDYNDEQLKNIEKNLKILKSVYSEANKLMSKYSSIQQYTYGNDKIISDKILSSLVSQLREEINSLNRYANRFFDIVRKK